MNTVTRINGLIVLIVALLMLATTATAGIDRSARQLSALNEHQLHGRRAGVAHVAAFYQRHRWLLAPRHATCWAHVPWSRNCNVARLDYRAARHELDRIDRRLDLLEQRRLLSATSTYLGAVAYVERFYGPQPFLRACPNGEGGFGRFVMNTGGSGAGGWLQFKAGTFYGIIDRAIADARAHGMPLPDGVRSWHSPLGQALAGRRMILDGRRGEWTGVNC